MLVKMLTVLENPESYSPWLILQSDVYSAADAETKYCPENWSSFDANLTKPYDKMLKYKVMQISTRIDT